MAGARFSIDTQGLDRLQASVRLMASSVRDTSTLMPRLGEYLQRSTQDRFKTQNDPDGEAWAAQHPHTLKRKKRKISRPCNLGRFIFKYSENAALFVNTVKHMYERPRFD